MRMRRRRLRIEENNNLFLEYLNLLSLYYKYGFSKELVIFYNSIKRVKYVRFINFNIGEIGFNDITSDDISITRDGVNILNITVDGQKMSIYKHCSVIVRQYKTEVYFGYRKGINDDYGPIFLSMSYLKEYQKIYISTEDEIKKRYEMSLEEFEEFVRPLIEKYIK